VGRVIKIGSAATERNQYLRSIVLALRELATQNEITQETHDLAAYIVIALERIYESIDTSVVAWEKRGYWVKADRFRLDWEWTERLSKSLRKSLLKADWGSAALVFAQIAEKVQNTRVPQRHRLGTPWVGAWEKISTPTKE
jgi:hypothetical protein